MPAIKKRDPTRFSFLMPTDKYHQFFQYKLALYKEMLFEAGLTPKHNVVTAVVGPIVPPKPTATALSALSANGAPPAAVPMPAAPTEQQIEQTVTKKFPTLKGFFN